ncbi:MAG: hypothetical protein K6U14_11415 [Firmicutes bacterium]|nr:hypothetical protein [Alicyclobacillaceae bacterium]MCL6498222.1 hypothetical protein [Bacillota bacterium]
MDVAERYYEVSADKAFHFASQVATSLEQDRLLEIGVSDLDDFARRKREQYALSALRVVDGGGGTLGMAQDAEGNLYIADRDNCRIRKVESATGIIRTVAGAGVPGFWGDGGSALNAWLDSPTGVAVDASGHLYIADSWNHRVRKVDANTEIITTLAGGGTPGYSGDGGPAVLASLYEPCGLALDAAGNLYIADMGNHRIRKVDLALGTISTVAGDGWKDGTNSGRYNGDGIPAVQASLNYPTGIAFDRSGNLLIADRNNHRIRKVDASSGLISTLAGNGEPGFSGDGGPAVDVEQPDRGTRPPRCRARGAPSRGSTVPRTTSSSPASAGRRKRAWKRRVHHPWARSGSNQRPTSAMANIPCTTGPESPAAWAAAGSQ